MGLILLIPGLILLLAGAGWFAGAATVGLILVIAGGVFIALQLILLALGLTVLNKANREIKRGFDDTSMFGPRGRRMQ